MRQLIKVFLFVATATSFAIAGTMSNSGTASGTRSVSGGGLGDTPASDFFGEVSSASPVQINGITTQNLSSGFSPAVGDIIGRDLSGTNPGFDFTNDSVTWTAAIPAPTAVYCAGTFDLSATFDSSLGFLGNVFGGNQPNALDFELTFDGVSQGTFQAQSGTHTAASLTAAFTDGAPVSTVAVTMTFPDGNSFNAGSEQFHIFADSLDISFSYDFDPVPEPSGLGLAMFAGLGILVLKRRG